MHYKECLFPLLVFVREVNNKKSRSHAGNDLSFYENKSVYLVCVVTRFC